MFKEGDEGYGVIMCDGRKHWGPTWGGCFHPKVMSSHFSVQKILWEVVCFREAIVIKRRFFLWTDTPINHDHYNQHDDQMHLSISTETDPHYPLLGKEPSKFWRSIAWAPLQNNVNTLQSASSKFWRRKNYFRFNWNPILQNPCLRSWRISLAWFGLFPN